MIFVTAPSTVLNRAALDTKRVPKPILDRNITLIPRSGAGLALRLRMLFEHGLLRYLIALVPFPIAMAIWPHLALPIAQAPLPMFILIFFVETRVLAIPSEEKRRALASGTEIARGLDRLKIAGEDILTRLATGRRLTEGTLTLVVEQSALARVPPLTLVSVQTETPDPALIDLSEDEQGMIRDRLFDAELTEQNLHRINLADGNMLRAVPLELGTISAHARLEALARA